MRPDATSSYRTSPGRIGSPAASAEVHPSGRSAFDPRSHTAPLPARGRPWFQSNANSSYSVHELRLTTSACRSLPPSTGVCASTG
jgi:hypothetical protein